jgi:hypothetical protein
MEAITKQPFADPWLAEPVAEGRGRTLDRVELREGARLSAGFDVALQAETEGLPPAAIMAVYPNGIVREV